MVEVQVFSFSKLLIDMILIEVWVFCFNFAWSGITDSCFCMPRMFRVLEYHMKIEHGASALACMQLCHVCACYTGNAQDNECFMQSRGRH